MTLFVKSNCGKCNYIEEKFDLKKMGIKVDNIPNGKLTDMDVKDFIEAAGVLSHLAWHEAVGAAEEILPILITDKSEVIAGAINIKKYLEKIEV